MIIFGSEEMNGWVASATTLNLADTVDNITALSVTLQGVSSKNNYLVFAPSVESNKNALNTLEFYASTERPYTIFVYWEGLGAIKSAISPFWTRHQIPLSGFGDVPDVLPKLVFWNNGAATVNIHLHDIKLTKTFKLGGAANETSPYRFSIPTPAAKISDSTATTASVVITVIALVLSLVW